MAELKVEIKLMDLPEVRELIHQYRNTADRELTEAEEKFLLCISLEQRERIEKLEADLAHGDSVWLECRNRYEDQLNRFRALLKESETKLWKAAHYVGDEFRQEVDSFRSEIRESLK